MNAQEAVAVLRGVQEHQGLYIDVRTAIQVVCDEVERLRATVNGLNAEIDDAPFVAELGKLLAERDAALAKCEMLEEARVQAVKGWNFALAEIERLRADTQELNAGWTECAVERDAALAEIERLKGVVSDTRKPSQ